MSVGIVIITHNDVGRVLLDNAVATLGVNPLRVALLAVHAEDDPATLRPAARELAREVDRGEGVLVLTDLFGSTPCNVAAALNEQAHVSVVAGLNLPMLLRVLNYPKLGLAELTEKAISGGRDGVLRCDYETA